MYGARAQPDAQTSANYEYMVSQHGRYHSYSEPRVVANCNVLHSASNLIYFWSLAELGFLKVAEYSHK